MSSWESKQPKRGDHIRVYRIGYCHHGVFVSNDEVIHFSSTDDDSILDWSKARVLKTTLAEFLRGGTVEVKIYDSAERKKLYPVDDIVEYARDCLGETGYNLIFENCEHFANECTIGEHRSKQVETVGTVLNILGVKPMGLFSTIAGFAANLLGNIFSGSSSSGRRPAKTEKVKLAEVERDKQVKLAEIEANTKLSLAEKENARTKIEADAKVKLRKLEREAQLAAIQAESQARMEEADQQARLRAIDNEFKIRLANKENERVELMRDAQIDIIKAQAMSQVMIERARAEGLTKLAENLIAFQERLIDLSNRRMVIIMSGTMPMIRELEDYYGTIIAKINSEREEYLYKKLPPLLEMLVQYKEGSPQYKLYYRQIENDQDMEKDFLTKQLNEALTRQQSTLDSFNRSREEMSLQLDEMAQVVAKGYLKAGIMGELPSGEKLELEQIPGVEEAKKLPGNSFETKLLTQG